MASTGSEQGFMSWWRERSAWKRARLEGRHLVKESRRILRKKSYRIAEAISSLISAQADAVDEALKGHTPAELEQARKAIAALDDSMDEHLTFARKSTMREYSESIGVAVAIALLLRAFVVEAFQIPSGSMIPTLEVGDHIFVSKFAYGLTIPFTNTKIFQMAEPKRGDIIVFKFPGDQSIDYIKRVVGLPGDVIEMRQEELYINGHAVQRERVPRPYHYSEASRGSGPPEDHESELWIENFGGRKHETIQEPVRSARDFERKVVPPGNVFVMGDNRDNSSDSRVWGTVDLSLIKGRALIVWWSRAPADGMSPVDWVKSIRWNRFFQVVQ
ncbi:MAG TPA: signal peptidase I [Polyangia bacterium]|jgi:signal peptidase I|nr:signal peptidase I [Polyangia bacterium]